MQVENMKCCIFCHLPSYTKHTHTLFMVCTSLMSNKWRSCILTPPNSFFPARPVLFPEPSLVLPNVHGVAKNQTQVKWLHTHTRTHTHTFLSNPFKSLNSLPTTEKNWWYRFLLRQKYTIYVKTKWNLWCRNLPFLPWTFQLTAQPSGRFCFSGKIVRIKIYI